jgi:hypothetical protein
MATVLEHSLMRRRWTRLLSERETALAVNQQLADSRVENQVSEPSLSSRLLVSTLIAAATWVLTAVLLAGKPEKFQGMDFTYPWMAAKAIASGIDPYEFVLHGYTPGTHTLFYPATAGLVALPFIALSARTAAPIFVAFGCAVLAFSVTKRHLWPALMFASGPAFQVCWSVQWSPLIMASAFWPAALGLVVTKPNLAIPLLLFRLERRALTLAVIGGGALTVVSLLLSPHWVTHWLETLRYNPAAMQYRTPLATPWGLAIGTAALRWRRPEARLLLGLACMPQNAFFYDQFPLFLIPKSRREMLGFTIISLIALLVPLSRPIDVHGIPALSARYEPYMFVGTYIPALIMVLTRRNEGDLPAWFERKISRLPIWVRGKAPVK